jgi:hypothetical protein
MLLNEGTEICGAILLHGFEIKNHEKNTIVFSKKSLLTGDLYCEGVLEFSGVVHGSVYTNKINTRATSTVYVNSVSDIEIDVTKRPKYFVGIPILANQSLQQYGMLKKVR